MLASRMSISGIHKVALDVLSDIDIIFVIMGDIDWGRRQSHSVMNV